MLSILIPVYNWEVIDLVTALHDQCSRAGIDFEIRCYEDGSTKAYQEKNENLRTYDRVVYVVFDHNIGRACMRNRLAEEAIKPFLLFLDCDSGLPDKHFIARYLDQLKEGMILYGGRDYSSIPPENRKYRLHWRYGRRREVAGASERQRSPYHRFMTNNFLIPRSICLQVRFEERLKQYGHEDTLFGQELQRRGIPIVHLDNPVIHLGLEEADVFLEKNRQAMENLHFLRSLYPGLQTHLLEKVGTIKKLKLGKPVLEVLHRLLPLLRRNLLSDYPRLRALDLFKLYYFLYYDQQ